MVSRNRKPKPPKGEVTAETFTSNFTGIARLNTQSGFETQRFSVTAQNPVVKSALTLVSNGAFWTQGEVSANPKNDYKENPTFEDLDNEIIDLQQSQLNKIGVDPNSPPNIKKSATFNDYLKSALEDGRERGFSIAEMIWEAIDGVQVLKKIKSKPPWNFNINVDETDEISSVDGAGTKGADPARFSIGTWPFLKWGNYYGVSDMLSITGDVARMEILENGLEQGGSWASYRPLAVHVLSKGLSKEQIDASKESINQMSSASTTYLPKVSVGVEEDGKTEKAYEFEMLEDRASEHALANVFQIVLELKKTINRCLGIPDDLGNVSTNAGSWAKAKTEFNLFVSKLEQCRQWVEEIAQRITDTICYYNFSDLPDGYLPPIWKFGTIEEEADKVRIDAYKVLLDSGLIHKDEPWIREGLNLPPKEEEFMDDTMGEEEDIEMEDQETVQETQELEDKGQSQTEGVGDLAKSLENAAKAAKGFNMQLKKIGKKSLIDKIIDFVRGH